MSSKPNKKLSHEIVIIGSGVIGMNIAFRLAKEGREVIVIDPGESRPGASFGNAGTISDYATVPVGTPNVLRNLPDLLFNRESPLSVRYGNFPSLLPWLIKFAYHCLPGPTETNARAIGLLLNNSSNMWHEMATELGASKHFRRRGCLYLYESDKAFKASKYDERLRRENGVDLEVITAKEVLELEPGLQPFKGGAHFFPNATSIDDPGKVMEILAQNLRELGVLFLKTTALSIDDNGSKIQVNCQGVTIDAVKVIIAAGAHSKALARSVGDRVPLDTERGYHIEYDLDVNPVSRPVCSAKRGFYASPMDGRLRIAGTVELGGLKLPPDPRRLKMLERGALSLFPDLGKPDRTWFGYRPSVPSSVPIIRKSKKNRNIILAFGHGHLGVTLAPATAKIVSNLISSNT